MSNIVVILGGVTLPTPDLPFKEITTPNESDNITLDGTMYTDFINWRRSWTMTWGRLEEADYDAIRQIFNNQYINETYPILQIAYYGIIKAVKVEISDKDIRWDGACVKDFAITLHEQYAIS